MCAAPHSASSAPEVECCVSAYLSARCHGVGGHNPAALAQPVSHVKLIIPAHPPADSANAVPQTAKESAKAAKQIDH